MGKKKQRYFSHKGDACDIAVAQQTALHMLAKEIIEENKQLLFPGIVIKRDDFVKEIKDYHVRDRIPQSIEYRKPSVVLCDSVLLEKKLSSIIPDIIVSAKGRSCLVEIAVTHFVDEEKEQKIKQIGLPLIEINLSSLYKSVFSRAELAKAVLHDPDNRTWIFNPLIASAEKWAKDEYSKLIISAKEAVDHENQIEIIKEKKKQQQRADREEKIRRAFEPDNYCKTVTALENEIETAKHEEDRIPVSQSPLDGVCDELPQNDLV